MMKNFIEFLTYNKRKKKSFVTTGTGVDFFPFNPNPDDIFIEDIFQSLSMQCRFNGHCSSFYSVARHSLIGSYIIQPEYALEFLAHDFSEAYISDIPAPIKKFMKQAVKIENKISEEINKKLNITFPMSKEVHEMDQLMFRMEFTYLMGSKEFQDEKFPLSKEDFMKEVEISQKDTKQEMKNRFLNLTA